MTAERAGGEERLRRLFPSLFPWIEKRHLALEVKEAQSGAPYLILKLPQGEFPLQSRYQPEKEGFQQAERTEITQTHLVAMAGGNPWYLLKVLEKAGTGCRVFYTEPYPELMLYTLTTLFGEGRLSPPPNFYPLLPDHPDFIDLFSRKLELVTLEKVEYLVHPVCEKFFNREYKGIRERMEKAVLLLLMEFATSLHDSRRIFLQILDNLALLKEESAFSPLQERFPKVPGVVVSAGPSLDKNLPYLKELEGRALIISVDTALRSLLSAGIMPHIVVTLDPSYLNALHLKGLETQGVHLVTELSVNPAALGGFRKRIFFGATDKPLLRVLQENIGPIGSLESWGTVASLALDTAVSLGNDPIFFFGQDLSFPAGASYARHTLYEDGWVFSRDNPSYLSLRLSGKENAERGRRVEDIFGRPVFTDIKMLSYRDYLKDYLSRKGRRFFNLTEGGILDGIPSSTAAQAVPLLPFLGRDLRGELERAHRAGAFLPSLGKLLRFLEAYERKFSWLLRKAKEAGEEIAAGGDPAQWGRVKGMLYDDKVLAELWESYSQEAIYHFLKEEVRSRRLNDETLLKEAFRLFYARTASTAEDLSQAFADTRKRFRGDT